MEQYRSSFESPNLNGRPLYPEFRAARETGAPAGSATCGYTLAELLVVAALIGLAGIAATTVLYRWTRVNVETTERIETVRRVRSALERFADDVREARAVLALDATRAVVWHDDADGDGNPGAAEVVEWTWAGAGTDWTRGGAAIAPLDSLEIGGDSAPPFTRHVVVFVAWGAGETDRLGTSVSLRKFGVE